MGHWASKLSTANYKVNTNYVAGKKSDNRTGHSNIQ
jgi:hypothetical protein